jgi:hypothetical protein
MERIRTRFLQSLPKSSTSLSSPLYPATEIQNPYYQFGQPTEELLREAKWHSRRENDDNNKAPIKAPINLSSTSDRYKVEKRRFASK